MNFAEQTNKRLRIANDISSQIKGIVKGALLGGSMGFGQHVAVTQESDIDMVIVCDKKRMKDLVLVEYYSGEIPGSVVNLFEEGVINFITVTKEVNSVEVNSYIYETKAYEDFCTLKKGIKGYTPKKPLEIQRNYGFDGSLIIFKRNVTPYQDGFLYEKPALVEGKFWSGPPRDDFTRGYHILQQENNFFSTLKDEVWKAILQQLIKEHGSHPDLNKTSILKAEFNYQRRIEKFPHKVIERIKKETEDRLRRLNSSE